MCEIKDQLRFFYVHLLFSKKTVEVCQIGNERDKSIRDRIVFCHHKWHFWWKYFRDRIAVGITGEPFGGNLSEIE